MISVRRLRLQEVMLLEPQVFGDDRGFFMESWNERTFSEATGLDVTFVQDNHSRSSQGVLRGLHYQLPPQAQGKLIRVTQGAIWDVAVDLRRSSATFGEWVGVELSDANKHQLWIPPGFAHGFVVSSDVADVLYKTTAFYASDLDRSVRWDDPQLAVEWPLVGGDLILSAKDRNAPLLADADAFD